MLERASKLQEAPTLLVTQKAISPGGFVKIQTVQHLPASKQFHRSSAYFDALIDIYKKMISKTRRTTTNIKPRLRRDVKLPNLRIISHDSSVATKQDIHLTDFGETCSMETFHAKLRSSKFAAFHRKFRPWRHLSRYSRSKEFELNFSTGFP